MRCQISSYEILLEPLLNTLSKRNTSTIILQLPDGLKQFSTNIVECVQNTIQRTIGEDVSIVVHADSTFGSCDLQLGKLELLGGDIIVAHVGHTPYPPELADPSRSSRLRDPRVIFLPARSTISAEMLQDAIDAAATLLRQHAASRILLLATTQHTHILRKVGDLLAQYGFEAFVPRGFPPYFEDGQVIGCDYRLARTLSTDAYLIVSGGLFHPLGLYLSTRKPVIQLDPYRSEARDITGVGEKVYRKRLYLISKAMEARSVGIIVGLKEGQHRPWLVRLLESKARQRGLRVFKFAIELLTRTALGNIDSDSIDFFAVTSCPRIPIDDLGDYHKPVLTPGETLMALEGTLEPYRFPW